MRNCKSLLFICAVLAICTSICGCVLVGFGWVCGSDHTVKVALPFEPDRFTGIIVSNEIEVDVYPSNEYEFFITANENLVEYLEIGTDGSNIRLGLRNLYTYTNVKIRAHISMPMLERISATTSAKVHLNDPYVFKDLHVDLSTSALVDGKVTVYGKLEILGTTSSQAELRGSAGNLDLNGNTSCSFRLFEMPCNYADIDLTTSAKAEVNVSNGLEYDLTTSSMLIYKGTPYISGSASTDASILKRL